MTNYKPVTEEVLEELRKAVGAEHVKNDAETLERYKTDEEPDAHYHHLPAFDAPEAISVSHGTADKVELIYSTPTRFLIPKNAAEPLTSTIELPQKLAAPVAQGTHLGTVQLSSGGEVLASFPISAAQDVDALSFRYCFGRLVDSLLLYQGDFVQNK